MDPPSKRRRIVTGCQACRGLASAERHLRCDNEEPCRQCELQNIQCVRHINVRFRSSRRDALSDFPTGQKWVSPPTQVEYHDETSEVASSYGQALWESNAPEGTIIAYNDARDMEDISTASSTANSEYMSSRANLRSAPTSGVELRNVGSSPAQSSPRQPERDQPPNLRPSPRQSATSPLVTESPASSGSFPIDTDYYPRRNPTIISFTPREAELIRNFSENMALWADITDIRRHFELEVPRRAFFNQIIRFAICAFSSRHINRAQNDATAESLYYHNKCLEMLIPILSNLDHELTEDILAAVAILRLDEEMEIQDNCFHLQGITRILNQVSSFCSGGGLGEATAWLCLRQEIYVSLVSQQPLRTQTANFERSSSLNDEDDLSWANRIVLLLAQVLSVAFLKPSVESDERLKRLGEKVEAWMRNKPSTFEPIKFIPREQGSQHRFPIIWMLHPFHVVGIQYYHIAKIVLAVSASQADPNKRYFFRWGRDVERRVRAHILTVIGLAKSNPRAENTLFTARHTLTVWGNILTKKADQEAVKDFLEGMEKKTGWTNSKLIANLEDQWNDSDDN